jgi:hypothetical protein
MSRFTSGILGMTVAALTLGAANLQIASGHDIAPSDASLRQGNDAIVYDVNRTGKADRVSVAWAGSERPTVVFEHPKMPFTTIAAQVRTDLSVADTKRQTSHEISRPSKPAAKQKMATACERNISALAEFAKQLDAGRCIT